MEALHRFVWPYLKAYAALIGSICTALLAVYAEDSDVNHWLTVIGVVATTIATFAIPNIPDDPNVRQQRRITKEAHDAARRRPGNPGPGH